MTDESRRDAALRAASELALDYLHALPDRHVGARADAQTVARSLGGALPEHGEDPEAVVRFLAGAADPGLVASAGPRYFGFVVGGALPASVATDWLAAA